MPWIKKAVKIDALFLVFKPTKYSVIEDLTTKTDMEDFVAMAEKGLMKDIVAAFTSEEEAKEYAEDLLEKRGNENVD